MGIKRYKSEDIVKLLKQVDIFVSQGKSISDSCRQLGICDASYYKWRKEYGGMAMSQVKRLRQLEQENNRLRRAVSDLTLDNQILKDVSRGKF